MGQRKNGVNANPSLARTRLPACRFVKIRLGSSESVGSDQR
jgi:hypothetical protein